MPTSLITTAAIPLLAAASGNATEVAITEIALGDGEGAAYDPNAGQTALVNEHLRVPIATRRFLAPQRWRVMAEVPSEASEFPMRDLIQQTHAALMARINGFLDEVNGDVAAAIALAQAQLGTRQAAYDALAADLIGVVSDQMYFTAQVDPADPAPTNERGGVFNTIKAAVDAAPAGAFVHLLIAPGSENVLEAEIEMRGRFIQLSRNGGTPNPVLKPEIYSTGAHNAVRGFIPWGGELYLDRVDVEFGGKADAGLPWSNTRNLIAYRGGARARLSMASNTVTSAEAVTSLATAFIGNEVSLAMRNVTLDGPFFAIQSAASGAVMVTHSGVTLLNGASLTSGGAVGTNILQNT